VTEGRKVRQLARKWQKSGQNTAECDRRKEGTTISQV